MQERRGNIELEKERVLREKWQACGCGREPRTLQKEKYIRWETWEIFGYENIGATQATVSVSTFKLHKIKRTVSNHIPHTVGLLSMFVKDIMILVVRINSPKQVGLHKLFSSVYKAHPDILEQSLGHFLFNQSYQLASLYVITIMVCLHVTSAANKPG